MNACRAGRLTGNARRRGLFFGAPGFEKPARPLVRPAPYSRAAGGVAFCPYRDIVEIDIFADPSIGLRLKAT